MHKFQLIILNKFRNINSAFLNKMRVFGIIIGVGSVASGIYGCATNAATEYNTPNARSSDNLMVPPGLSSPELNSNYKILNNKPESDGGYKLDKVKNMRIAQGGSERWLVVSNSSVDQVWPMMIAYLTGQGLVVKYKNQSVGLIQTEWASRNNTVHETGVRSVFDWIGWGSMYSMKSQYMFRINMWQNGNDANIFVTDFQMDEVYPGCNASKNSTVETSDHQVTRWMPIAPNPQLELDFLLHFIAYAGSSSTHIEPEAVKAAESKVTKVAPIAHLDGNNLIMDDSFDRAWWRTGLALERVGLGVSDKNRTSGMYYVYQLQSQVENPEPGVLSRWFGNDSNNNLALPKAQYDVKLVAKDNEHTVLTIAPTAQNTDKDSSEVMQKYLANLLKQLQ